MGLTNVLAAAASGTAAVPLAQLGSDMGSEAVRKSPQQKVGERSQLQAGPAMRNAAAAWPSHPAPLARLATAAMVILQL